MKKQANWGMIIGVAVAVLMLAGVGAWLALGCGEKRTDTPVEEAARELPDGLLATNEPLIQELYEQFEISSLQEFYVDELLTQTFGGNQELEGGTDATGRYIRRLERAEKIGDRIYLYERVVSVNCQPDLRFDEEGNQIGNGSSCGVLTVAATCGTPEFGWSGDEEGMTDEEVLNKAAEKRFGVVRWVFEKNAEGNYVFRSLERVIEGEDGEEIDVPKGE